MRLLAPGILRSSEMAGEWRLLPLSTHDAFTNMAIDEAILVARGKGLVPNTLRLYRWDPSAVSLGMNRPVEEDVYVEACKRLGIDIVRRPTGGGTVYHDRDGEITYSVVADARSLGSPDVPGSYAVICSGLVKACELLGLRAQLHPGGPRQCPNILVAGKKISGNAQAWRGRTILQHGTFLVRVDLRRMFTVLRVPWSSDLDEVVQVAERKITSVERELNRPVSIQEAYEALVKGFEDAFGIELEEGELTELERRLAQRLYETKYSRDEWNLYRKLGRTASVICAI